MAKLIKLLTKPKNVLKNSNSRVEISVRVVFDDGAVGGICEVIGGLREVGRGHRILKCYHNSIIVA